LSLIIPLGWLDTWGLSCAIRRRRADLLPVEDEPGIRRLDVLDQNVIEDKNLRNFSQRLISKIGAALKELQHRDTSLIDYRMTGAWIEEQAEQTHTPWQTGFSEILVHVGIVTNPATRLYFGFEQVHIEVGGVYGFPDRPDVLRCSFNDGKAPRIHAVMSFTKRQEEGFSEP
jgi:hypothetical protein